VAITFAPRRLATCTAARPVEPEAPWMSTVSPAAEAAAGHQAVVRGLVVAEQVARLVEGEPPGTGARGGGRDRPGREAAPGW
jgi:hypothetical protein